MMDQVVPNDLQNQQPAVSPTPPAQAPVQQPATPPERTEAPAAPVVPEGYVPKSDIDRLKSLKDQEVARERAQFQAAAREWQQREAQLLEAANKSAALEQRLAELDVINKGGSQADVEAVKVQYDREKLNRERQAWDQQRQAENARQLHQVAVTEAIQYARAQGLADNEIPSPDQIPNQNAWYAAVGEMARAKAIRERDELKSQLEARQKPGGTMVSQFADGEATNPEDREFADLREQTRTTGKDTLLNAVELYLRRSRQ
jgi:hypothetical protein